MHAPETGSRGAPARDPWILPAGGVDRHVRAGLGRPPPVFRPPPLHPGRALEFRGGVGVLQQPQATLVLLAGGAPLLAAPWPAGSWPPGPPIFLRILGGSRSPNYRYASSTPKVGPQARACTCRAVRTAQQVQQAQLQGVLAGRSLPVHALRSDLDLDHDRCRKACMCAPQTNHARKLTSAMPECTGS